MPDRFILNSKFTPMGDQPQAIAQLVDSLRDGQRYQTLLGATGTGKTFSIANVIATINKPTLVVSHNKTLAAQLYEEFKELFPENAVSYFVSYYDYYQPEAYIPQRDIYIEKDSSRNDDLDRLRLSATTNLAYRRDVIVVASVSCIFGLGSPDIYKRSVVSLMKGQQIDRQDVLHALNNLQYTRAEIDFKRGTYRVRGDVVELRPASEEIAYRIEFFGDTIDRLSVVDPLTGIVEEEKIQFFIYPAVHYLIEPAQREKAALSIREELDKRYLQLRSEGKLLEAQRIMARTKYDLEMIEQVGVCPGIENYSRHLDGRPPGAKPYTLMDYFPDASSGEYQGGYVDGSRSDAPAVSPAQRNKGERDWLMVIDESHVTLPQMRAMFHGDRQRKTTLVEHGFRLPSAMDNRPLRFEEIESVWPQVIFVSATPSAYELEKSEGIIAEQVIRPTGLVDPIIEIRSAQTQVPDLCEMARKRTAAGQRTIVTTLTKRLAEDLATYLAEQGLKCRYLHSDIHTIERVEILRDLRTGDFDVLIGVNLLREGLDLPEVSLVAIMDADKAGFLRSTTSLIQQIGRAARNSDALVILYADGVTPAMQQAIEETNRRRAKQVAYNTEHGITPQTIQKAIRHGMELEIRAARTVRTALHAEAARDDDAFGGTFQNFERSELLAALEKEMLAAADEMQFEKAAELRDRIKEIKDTPLDKPLKQEGEEKKVKPGTPGTKVMKKGKKGKSPKF